MEKFAVRAMIILLETVYLEQLVRLKMLILISINILDMELDLIEEEVFHSQVAYLGKM